MKVKKFETKLRYVGDSPFYKLFTDDIYYMVGTSSTLGGKFQIILDVPVEIDHRGPLFTGMNQLSVTKEELESEFEIMEGD